MAQEMTGPITCVVTAGDACGEAAVWDDIHGVLYWSDVTRFLIHRFDPRTRTFDSWFFDEPVVALSLSEDPDLLLVALGSKLIWWRPGTDERRAHGFALRDYPAMRFNDGRADPLGNFWVGSMRNNVRADGELIEAKGNDGILFRVSPDGEATEWERGIAAITQMHEQGGIDALRAWVDQSQDYQRMCAQAGI